MQVSQDLAAAMASGQAEDVRNQLHAAVRTLSNRTSDENDNKEVRALGECIMPLQLRVNVS